MSKQTNEHFHASGFLGTKLVAVQMVPETWEQFKKLALSQGLSSSSLLRQMVARELRKAAKVPPVRARSDRR